MIDLRKGVISCKKPFFCHYNFFSTCDRYKATRALGLINGRNYILVISPDYVKDQEQDGEDHSY